MTLRLWLCLALLLGLTACGDLPEPFLGNPGATARRLAQPPTPRLVIPPAGNALLGDAASRVFADDLARALQAQEVPAFAQAPRRGDWRLVATAESRAGAVVPMFTVVDPKGVEKGRTDGIPVPSKDWADASHATLSAAAINVAPKIASLLTRIEIAREKADPSTLYNRPAKVVVAEVTGAPGDGDSALSKQMRTRLAALGPIVEATDKAVDFTVRGHVRVVPIGHGQERVEIQWVVNDAAGNDIAHVVQLKDLPVGSLGGHWGDVAVVVATEASGGVVHVIDEHRSTPPRRPVTPAALHGQAGGRLLESSGSGVERPVRQ